MSIGEHPVVTPSVVAGAVDLGDDELGRRVSQGLSEVERVIIEELSRGDDIITDKSLHLVRAGGKRFRPMFALVASEFGEHPMSEAVIKAAAVIEMTHLATLYHDDVMDEAPRRRGVESANARWGNSVAILAGDHLLAQASSLLSELGSETVRHFSHTFGTLVTGQMRETLGAGDADPVEHYARVIEEKTGVLIASAGYLGGLHSGAPREYLRALYGFGNAVGMVFQIVDDIIDIYSDAAESGKAPGTDLREGIFTLPVLYAAREDIPAGARLRELLAAGPLSDDESVGEVLDLLSRSGGRQRALEDVRRWEERALRYLAELPEGPAAEAMRRLVRYTAHRAG